MSAEFDKSQWDAKLRQAFAVAGPELDATVAGVAARGAARIRSQTPVLTGRLQGSIRETKLKTADYDISSGVWYLPYVEYRNRNGAMFAKTRPAIEADLTNSVGALLRTLQ